jgi:hypothetical protein
MLFISCEQKLIVLDNCSKKSAKCSSVIDEVIPGPITAVQSASSGYTNSTSASTVPLTTQPSTNFLVFVSRQNISDTTGFVTDNMGNSFTEVLFSDVTDDGVGTYEDGLIAYSCFDCVGGSNHIFTSTTVLGYPSIFVIEISSSSIIKIGASTSSSVVQSNPILSGSVSTGANSLLVSFATSGEGSNPVYTWNNDFIVHTEITNVSYWYGSIATKSISIASNYEASMSTSIPDAGTSLLIELIL